MPYSPNEIESICLDTKTGYKVASRQDIMHCFLKYKNLITY